MSPRSESPPPSAPSSRFDFTSNMSQPVVSTQLTGPEFSFQESVYLERNERQDHKDSQANTLDDNYVHPDHNSSTNDPDNANPDANSRNKRREEKHSRWLAEQSSRVREKFDLPATDHFIASFSAALLSTILLQGRMYITTNHLCFYTKLFGKVTKECLAYSSLARVKKRRGGLVANAIKVYFSDEAVPPVVIGSLNHREKAYSLIQERLRIVNPNAAEPQEEEEDGSAGSVASTPIESEYPNASARTSADNSATCMPVRQLDSLALSTHSDENIEGPGDIVPSQPQTLQTEQNNYSQNNPIPEAQNSLLAGEWERSLVWCTPDDVVGNLVANTYDKKAERARGILDAPIKEVFNLLYISKWLKDYHNEVDNYEVEIEEWQRDGDGHMCRDVRFRRPIGVKLGPKETRVEEKQWFSFTDQGGVIIEVQGRNLDVPYSSYFVVESFFEMSPMNEGRQTLLVASVAVHFSKSTWLQGKIESGTLSETKTAYERLVNLASKRIKAHVSGRAANLITTSEIQKHRQEMAGSGPAAGNRNASSGAQPSVIEMPFAPNANGRFPEEGTNVEDPAALEAEQGRQDGSLLGENTGNGFEEHAPDGRDLYRKASLGLLGAACLLLLAVIIMLFRVSALLLSLEKAIDTLKDSSDGSKQC